MALSDYEAVREVIQQYIHGSGNGDAEALRAIFFPEAVMSGDYQGKLSFGTPDSFFELIENSPALVESGANYKSVISSIEVVGDVASAVLKEEGFFDANFTDFFHLMKVDGQWKIISKTYTTE
jgi:hypothetical protein